MRAVRRAPAVLVVAVVLAGAAPAAAATRTLYRSDSFRLRARLEDRLVLWHENRTDYALRFHCTTWIEEVRYRSSGTLVPHEVWKPHQHARSASLRGARADCDVNLHDGQTILWKDDRLEVLGKDLTQSSGAPKTRFAFYDITKEKLTFDCSWDQTANGQTSHQTLSDSLAGYGVDRLDAPGVDLISVANFDCTES